MISLASFCRLFEYSKLQTLLYQGQPMQTVVVALIKILFAPITFGLLFLGPLLGELFALLGLFADASLRMGIAIGIGGCLGIMAQIRGSWVWLKR